MLKKLMMIGVAGASLALGLGACRSQKPRVPEIKPVDTMRPLDSSSTPSRPGLQIDRATLPQANTGRIIGGVQAPAPRAVAYRLNNAEAASHVMVRVDNAGTLVYYPAPTDVGPASQPLSLGDGWYLDRQGAVAPGQTRFLKYTYSEYRALPEAPSAEQILQDIIPQMRVVSATTLPFTPSEAQKELPAVKKLLESLAD